ncbi:MAG: lysophospholipid acyltransferase family protein [SAR324 cluster bacterium]|nr:lysophospholipid acyltransferase family protein [SAR324 cluster bacterium]
MKRWLSIQLIVLLVRGLGKLARAEIIRSDIPQQMRESHGNYILATWHNNIFISAWLLRFQGYAALISQSKDGEGIYSVVNRFGFTAIRGSSSRGGAKALLEMSRSLKQGTPAAVTPDGPRGPIYKVQPGILMIAKMTGLPIIPWHAEASRQWEARSWDRHKFPKPFSRIVAGYGQPFYVPSKLTSEQIPEYAEALEQHMNDHMQMIRQQLAVKP